MAGTSSQSLLIRAETLATYSVSYMHILLQVELVQVMPGSTKSVILTNLPFALHCLYGSQLISAKQLTLIAKNEKHTVSLAFP